MVAFFYTKNITNPLDNLLCRNIIEAAKRSKTAPVKKKLPISSDMIREIINKYATPGATLKELRTACICTLGYAGFFRYDELSNISANHIEQEVEHIRLFVPQSKIDVYREGNYVFIKCLRNQYCPVALLERYMNEADIDPNSNLPIFRPVRLYKSKKRYALYGTKLSYTRCREVLKECLESLGHNSTLYGLHSLRSGGATVAVNNNPELPERMLKLHGRWKSSIAKDMYIQESINKRLTITNSLGL